MNTIDLDSVTDNDILCSSWASENSHHQEHHVYFVNKYNIYLLANYETGIVEESLTFCNFNDLVNELKKSWYPLIENYV